MGRARPCRSKCCSGLDGSITPTSASPGAISSHRPETCALAISTMGAAGEPISAAAAAGKPVAVGSITASGFAGRCFRARSVATAAGLPASQAR